MTRILWTFLLVASLSGCGAVRNRFFAPDPWGGQCALPPNITKDQLVARLNENIQGSATSSGIAAWRSTNVKITATGMPPGISVPASIAVEAPRNFRLRVSEPLTRVEALDMGSNHELFWFWAKDSQPAQVITVSHDALPDAQRELKVPFHPDWLMEVFGVIPIDGTKYAMRPARPGQPTLDLVAENLSPGGATTTKVIRVDSCHGRVLEHALYDSRGVLIARAALADHRIDKTTGIVVPHVVSFFWPAMQQSMKMVLGTIELNPPHMPGSAWQVPHKPGTPHFDLSQVLSGERENPSIYGVGSPFGIVPPPETAAGAPRTRSPVSGTDDAFQPTFEGDTVNRAADSVPQSYSTEVPHPAQPQTRQTFFSRPAVGPR